MRHWLKIFVLVFCLAAIFISAAYLYVFIRGASIITRELEGLTGRKTTLGYFNVTLPFNIEVYDLNIKGLCKVDRVYIFPNILYLLSGKINVDMINIIRPQLTYERNNDSDEGIRRLLNLKKWWISALVLRNLTVNDGRIDFVDRRVSPEGILLLVKDINFSLNNAYLFPFSVITNFQLKGKIPWQEGKVEGTIETEGWLNLYKKDMQALLKIKDIDGIYLYPYYSKWVDLEKSGIESASLRLTSNIHGLNNDVTAECRLEFTDILRKPRVVGEPKEMAEKVADAILAAFNDPDAKSLALDFTIKTKMDKPEFSFSDIKTAVEEKIIAQAKANEGLKPQDILMLPTKIIEGTVKGAADISKAVIDGTFAVGNEFKNAIGDSFKRERD